MNVAIDATGGDDQVFAGDGFRGGADDEIRDRRRPLCQDFRLCRFQRCGRL